MRFLILLLLTFPAYAWDHDDTVKEVLFIVSHAIDYGQTLHIADKCNTTNYHELNPIIGRCPTHDRVTGYFLATTGLHYLVAKNLPKGLRHWFQFSTLAGSLYWVNNNFQIGLRTRF